MFNFLISLSLRSRALVLGVFAILAGAALLAWRSMPINVFPAFATPRVVIGTTLPGMAPRDMETLVTYPIETAVSGTMGIRVVRSKTTLGVSLVTVVFHAAPTSTMTASSSPNDSRTCSRGCPQASTDPRYSRSHRP